MSMRWRGLTIALLSLHVSLCTGADPLNWKPGNGFRAAELRVPSQGTNGFTLMPSSATGINFSNLLSPKRHLGNQILLNGSGVAAGDVDGDGWCDVFFSSLDGPNALYRNLGNWKFQDVTESAGVGCPNIDATGAAFADLDGDGDLDLVVNSIGGGTHLFLNNGKGKFTLLTRLNLGKGGTSLALGDIDGDGFLDLYVANYRTNALMDMPNTRFWLKPVNGRQVISTVNGRPVTDPEFADRFFVNAAGGIVEMGETDVLFRNIGGTSFAPISWSGGAFQDEDGKPILRPPFDWGLSVAFRDLNGDGQPDIYVCNDFDSPDRIWLNLGSGKFRLAPRLTNRKSSFFAMGVDFADINRDGFDDIFVLDMLSRDHVHRMSQMGASHPVAPVPGVIDNRPQYMLNTLFLNRGDGTFAEIAQLAGVDASEWSWAAIFLDVDLDGWEDLLISNGHERDARNLDVSDQLRALRTARQMSPQEILEARTRFPRLATENLAFRNQHDLTFRDVTREWGLATPTVSHGMALADLDNDGDLDLIVNNLNDPAGVFRNEASAPRIAVRLKGNAPNTRGIGARIKVSGGPVAQSQEMMCGGRYVSGDDSLRVFAAGNTQLEIDVQWRSGRHSRITGATANRIYEIAESVSEPRSDSKSNAVPMFEDVSRLLGHVHHQESFDDFARQPSLEKKLSQPGPGVCWADINADGWEDLIIGASNGGRLSVFRNEGKSGFARWQRPEIVNAAEHAQESLLAWPKAPGQTVLLVAPSNYESGPETRPPLRVIPTGSGPIEEVALNLDAAVGPMAMADIDGDGDLDLFVGGRCIAGKYPMAASSLLFRNNEGKLEADPANKFANIGLVSGACFSDLDADGFPELVLACEWGPVRVFRNEKGRFRENTTELGLSKYIGWWNGVSAGDFDGDGKLDLVASNWGRNTSYQGHRSRPLLAYFGDIDEAGKIDLVHAYHDQGLQKIVPERMLGFLARSIRTVGERWTSHEQYGRAGIDEILGPRFSAVKPVEANWLETTLFLNRGDHFEARALPVEAQMAPAFAICVADFDGDGAEDLFLSQNFFALQPDVPRYDAGRGLLMRGEGKGNFAAVTGQGSGITIYGEQRGAAVADYDRDGRVDLVVTQNGAETKLYHNRSAAPGLRVRMTGPKGNPTGVGCVLRAGDGSLQGPAREIHAGSGYWSQESAMQVFGATSKITKLSVRWPGSSQATEAAVPASAREIQVDQAGAVKVIQ